MQEKKESIQEAQEPKTESTKQSVSIPFQPNKERNHKGVHYPDFWRKTKFKREFVKALEKTVQKDPVVVDEHGEYKDGVFLWRAAIVRVTINSIGLWRVEIHSEKGIGLPLIEEIRYKFVPDSILMVQLYPSRKENPGNKDITLYQMPEDDKETEEVKSVDETQRE